MNHGILKFVAVALAVSWMGLAAAAPAVAETQKQPINIHAIVMFFLFVMATLGITYWAAKRTKTASDYYSAGGGITGTQNGLAIAGDYMSAATLLGLTSLTYFQGFDGYIYCICFYVGWPFIMFIMAERLRNLGKFTFADITSYRLDQRQVRTIAAIGSLTVVVFYLIAQMVGAGQLIKLLFGLDYWVAVVIVGVLMVVYVTFGGMIATTVKKKPTQRVAMNTLLRASLALGTVKKRIRMCGRPAVPNISPRDRETAVTGSASREPGPIRAMPFLELATAWVVSVSKLKPNCEKASSITTVPPPSSRQALMICTQVVAIMPPKVT